MYATNGLSTETHKSFLIHYSVWGGGEGECLKRILAYLDCIKYNEINIGHSHIQKHSSNKK